MLRLLLTSAGIKNPSIHDALVGLLRQRTQRAARRLYLYSLLYLALLFVAMMVDHALPK